MRRSRVLVVASLILVAATADARGPDIGRHAATEATAGRAAAQMPGAGIGDILWFFEAAATDEDQAEAALARIAEVWRDAYASLLVDLARMMRSARGGTDGADFRTLADEDTDGRGVGEVAGEFAPIRRRDPSAVVRRRLIGFLEDQTGKNFGDDLNAWRKWLWTLPYEPHPDYATFKSILYGQIDPRMADLFPQDVDSTIRLDEIEWGGIEINGIPPLEYPEYLTAEEEDYLNDNHIVFGVSINGEARAYPKRILAWHEMLHDELGGVELTIVYCPLCGTVIPYESEAGGEHRRFGTSGLLYRSNKLMFDESTLSLWSTFEGKPVVGPLVGSGLSLRARPVVTTTWKDWRTAHPDTTVLSVDTGFERDYREGAAYREYLSHDRLMFEVSATDDRLKNKEEVLVMLLTSPDGESDSRLPVAIVADFLEDTPVLQRRLRGQSLVVVTSREGANRVYQAGDRQFVRLLEDGRLEDSTGARWQVTEDALVPEGDPTAHRARVSAQRAFWFGWYAQFPDTELVTK